jgi:hypothetical protein
MKISCRSQRAIEAMLCFVALFLFVAIIVPAVSAQSNPPRLVPYTITTIAGGATAAVPQGTTGFSGGTVCGAPWPADHTGVGPTWPTPPFDFVGDGCPATQAALNADRYAIPDPFGTVWVLDTGDGANADIRWVNPLTGIITAYNWGNSANDGSPRGIAFDFALNAYYMGENKSKGWFVDYISGNLSQIAGNTSGGSGCSGDDVKAIGDGIDNPSGVAPDALGNLYFVDNKCFRVRRIDPTGTMWYLAGIGAGQCTFNATGTAAFNGYPAAIAKTVGLNTPYAVTVDPLGNVYIANQTCFTLIEVLADPATVGTLGVPGVGYADENSQAIVLAGTGVNPSGYTFPQMCYGNEPCGPATTLPFEPAGVQVDPEGPVKDSSGNIGYNLFIQEGSHVWYYDFATRWMRRIAGGNSNCAWMPQAPSSSLPAGTVTSLGDSCPATNSYMTTAYGVDVDALGNLYIGDDGDNVVRKIFKGTEMTDGSALWLNAPFVPQYYPGGAPVPFQGTTVAQAHFDPGDSPAANSPFQVFGTFTLPTSWINAAETAGNSPDCTQNAWDNSWDCVFSISYGVSSSGTVTTPMTVKGTASGSLTDYPAVGTVSEPAIALDPGTVTVVSSSVSNPGGVAVDSLGNWYVADTGNNRILKNGLVLVGGLNAPQGVAVDGAGNVYIADTGNNVVKEWHAATQTVTVVAGGGTPCTVSSIVTFSSDALGNNCYATMATLNHPTALAVDSLLNLYILDQGNAEIRRVDPRKHVISLVAGGGGAGIAECGGGSSHPRCATLDTPIALAVGAPGMVYVIEGGSTNDIKLINLLKFPATIAQVSTNSPLSNPTGVAVDAAGDIYYSEASNQAVGMVNAAPASIDQLILGLDANNGDTSVTAGAAANTIALSDPGAVAVDPAGNVYVADVGNNRILMVNRSQSEIQFEDVASSGFISWTNVTVTNVGTQPLVLQPLSVSGANATDFTIQGTCGTSAMAAGASCEIQALAETLPSDSGPLSAAISVAGNAVNTPVIQLAASAGEVTATTTALSFNPALTFSGEVTNWVAQVLPSSCTHGSVSFTVDGELSTTVSYDSEAGNFHTPFMWKNGKDPFLQTCGAMTLQALYTDPTGVCSDSQSVQTVALPGAPTTTSLAASGGSSSGGVLTIPQYQPLTLTASIQSTATGTPTGTVQYWVTGLPGGDQLLSTLLVPQEGTQIAPPSIVTLNGNGAGIFTTQWLPPGTYQIYAKYSGDCNFNPSDSHTSPITVTVTQVSWDFSMALQGGTTPATINGPEGSVATATIILTPINYPGVSGASINGTTSVTFKCSGEPAYSTCSFGIGGNPVTLVSPFLFPSSPAYLPCANNADAKPPCTVQLDLVTNLPPSAASLTEPKGLGHSHGLPVLAALALMFPGLVLVGAGLGGELRSRKGLRRKLFFLLGMMLLAGILLGLPGCGGNLQKVNAVTPPGTYPITVTATLATPNGNVVHTIVVPVTVTPLQ